jgi:hypothetical protein
MPESSLKTDCPVGVIHHPRRSSHTFPDLFSKNPKNYLRRAPRPFRAMRGYKEKGARTPPVPFFGIHHVPQQVKEKSRFKSRKRPLNILLKMVLPNVFPNGVRHERKQLSPDTYEGHG